MCLALYKPAKATLNKQEMQNAFKANPDGAGFAYYDPALRQVVIQRGYFTFASLWYDLEPIMDDKLPLILHFRWATHGDVTVANCHPFQLFDGALIHNGIISGMGDSYASYNKYYTPSKLDSASCGNTECDDDRSDTREFVEDYLDGMNVNVLRGAKKLIEHTIGHSKLVTIHNDGSVIIFNEDRGHWREGVWYSNDSYAPNKAKSANPVNLVPAKYDYYGKSRRELVEGHDEGLFSKDPDSAVDGVLIGDLFENPLTCPRCWNEDDHEVLYDAEDDSFLISCRKCDESWIINAYQVSYEDYEKLYAMASIIKQGN